MTPVALIVAVNRRLAEAVEPGGHLVGERVDGARLGAGRESVPLLGDDRARDVDDRFRTAALPQPRPARGRDGARRSAGGDGSRSTSILLAGAHGSRTHCAAPGAAPLVLKTRGPTGTRPLPPNLTCGERLSRLDADGGVARQRSSLTHLGCARSGPRRAPRPRRPSATNAVECDERSGCWASFQGRRAYHPLDGCS